MVIDQGKAGKDAIDYSFSRKDDYMLMTYI